jgi:multiple antibiotic resistance protein
MLFELLQAFVALFIIIDPFLSLSVFLGLTEGLDKKQFTKQVWIAVGVAAGMLALFLVFGALILNIMHISFESFKIGGGIILLILGIRTCLGKGFQNKTGYHRTSIVVIGTPMLSGPGALTTVIVMSQSYGLFVVGLACIAVLVLTWLMLYYSQFFQRILSSQVMEIFSRIMGLLLTALGAQYIIEGIRMLIATA